MKKNILAHVLPKTAILPAARANGTTNGGVIDRLGYEAGAVVVHAGALGGGTLTVKLQHGDQSDGSDMADFATNSPTTAGLTADNTLSVIACSLVNAKRYVRAVATLAGAAGSQPFSAELILGDGVRSIRDSDHSDFDGFFLPHD